MSVWQQELIRITPNSTAKEIEQTIIRDGTQDVLLRLMQVETERSAEKISII
jgi:hypothetical protein